jgi:hypothetical protein
VATGCDGEHIKDLWGMSMPDSRHEEFCDGMVKKVGPNHCGCMEVEGGKADSAGIFVYKVQKKLLDVYEKMSGRGDEYVKWTELQEVVGTCVVHFWLCGEDYTWTSKDVEDETVLTIIANEVRPRLAQAMVMGDLKALYSEEAQAAFDDLWWYVREWYREDGVEGTETRGDDRLRTMIDDLRSLMDEYDT